MTCPKNAVKVENIPLHVDRRDVVALFDTLVGDVRNSSDMPDSSGSHLVVSFLTCEAAKKALCMSGYKINEHSLIVTSIPDAPDSPPEVEQDDRRNLYVLGLPYDLTKNEFAHIFSQYGPVSHCVLLATVDNASRRRGFVVMANHDAAKKAMKALTRTQIKGHAIDVSWAIVQRSKGFLDGGDRATVFDPRLPRVCSPDDSDKVPFSGSPTPSIDSTQSDIASLTVSLLPSSIIRVSNLPTFLFSEQSDLRPLFYPYGQIKKLELATPSDKETTSVVVEYSSIEGAHEAKENLQGQCYANYKIKVEYLQRPSSPVQVSGYFSGRDDKMDYERHGSASITDRCFRPLPPFRLPRFYQDHLAYSFDVCYRPHGPYPRGYSPHPSFAYSYCPPVMSWPSCRFSNDSAPRHWNRHDRSQHVPRCY